MEKTTIRLNEQELSNIVKNVLKETLNEVTIKQSAICKIFNLLGNNDMLGGNDMTTFSSVSKPTDDVIAKARRLEYELLSNAINQELEDKHLLFVQQVVDGNNTVIDFYIEKVPFLGHGKLVLEGTGIINKETNRPLAMKIYYDYINKVFYRITSYRANGSGDIKIVAPMALAFPNGAKGRFAINVFNKQRLFDLLNKYVDYINSQVPNYLQINAHF